MKETFIEQLTNTPRIGQKRCIRRLGVASDLAFSSVEDAMKIFREGVGIQSGTLIVSEAEEVIASHIREEFARLTDIGLGVIVLPDAMLSSPDTWALMNENHQIVWGVGV